MIIGRLISDLDAEGAEIDHLEHALFLYESYLPTMVPVMAERVGVAATDFSPAAGETALALTSRHECRSVQLRQFALNVAELIVR